MGKRLGLGLLLVAAMAALTSCGGSGSTKTTPPAAVTITVNPPSANVPVGTQATFMANVMGTTNMAATWQVNGSAGNPTIGTITSINSSGISTGIYTAPQTIPSPANVTITAVSQANTAKIATAKVMIGPNVVVNPPGTANSPVTVQTFGSQKFSATVSGGVTNTNVTWQLICSLGGTACGAIHSDGSYKAPNSVPTTSTQGGGSVAGTVTVTAVSQANTSFSGSSIVAVTSQNQQPQQPPTIPMGSSGGNAQDLSTVTGGVECCGGTLGALLTRGTPPTLFILSNNHVLARSDQGVVGKEKIIQPGLIDASNPCTTSGTTTVGTLSQFFNLETGAGTKVDAAIAQIVAGTVDPTGSIEELGATTDVNGVPQSGSPKAGSGMAATVNEQVSKSGRSTGVTCANVGALHASVQVTYQKGCGTGAMFNVNYADEVMVDGAAFGAEGDSGSLIVDAATATPVALLFAGDSTSTIGNPVIDETVSGTLFTGVLTSLKDSKGNKPTFVGSAAHAVKACSLPPPSSATVTEAGPTVSEEVVQRATAVRDRHAVELMANPAVAAVGVGASLDSPTEAAVFVFVQKGVTRNPIPAEVEGVRTRIIERENFPARGALSREQSTQLASEAAREQAISLPDSEVERASAIKENRVQELMSDTAVQGVGVAASLDSPGEAALILYVLKGKAHNPIPATIDGLRTRIKETTGFRAGLSGDTPRHVCSAPAPALPQKPSKKSPR
jgi:hypothetical protein